MARLEAPQPLEGSSRRQGRMRSTEYSLRDESVWAVLDLVVSQRVWSIHIAAAGRREACPTRPYSVTISWANSSRKSNWLLVARPWASCKEQLLIWRGDRKVQDLKANVKTPLTWEGIVAPQF